MAPETKALLKKELLNVAEKHLMMMVDDLYAVAEIYVKSTDGSVDDTVLMGAALFKDTIKTAIDKVDGEVG